jgi:hypothetical protein
VGSLKVVHAKGVSIERVELGRCWGAEVGEVGLVFVGGLGGFTLFSFGIEY